MPHWIWHFNCYVWMVKICRLPNVLSFFHVFFCFSYSYLWLIWDTSILFLINLHSIRFIAFLLSAKWCMDDTIWADALLGTRRNEKSLILKWIPCEKKVYYPITYVGHNTKVTYNSCMHNLSKHHVNWISTMKADKHTLADINININNISYMNQNLLLSSLGSFFLFFSIF